LVGERERKLAGNALLAAERGAKLTAQLLAFPAVSGCLQRLSMRTMSFRT
jgi:hypothetical protein